MKKVKDNVLIVVTKIYVNDDITDIQVSDYTNYDDLEVQENLKSNISFYKNEYDVTIENDNEYLFYDSNGKLRRVIKLVIL